MTFEECKSNYEKILNRPLDYYQKETAVYFWDAAYRQGQFDANNEAGRAANEAAKDARRKEAVNKILAGDNLDAAIKEAQG